MTLELALSAFLAGIALGLRYKVVILIPAIVFVMLFAMIVGIARGDRFLLLAVAIPGAAIQIGYLAGAHIRAVVDDHLTNAFAPKVQACENEAADYNAKGDREGVTE
jgi:hypothetical protein